MSADTNLSSILSSRECTRVQSLIQRNPVPLGTYNSGGAKAHRFSAIRIASEARRQGNSPRGILMMPDTMRDVSLHQQYCTRAKIAFEILTGVLSIYLVAGLRLID